MENILSEISETTLEKTYFSKCSKIYPTVKTDVSIPKIIMQSWKNNNIPNHWVGSPKSIQKIMPDWKYVFMTDEDNRNMIKKHFPDFLPYFDALPYHIQKVDCSRYAFLYLYGGIYIDMDFLVQKDLSPLFQSGDIFLVSSGNVSGYYTNSFMASKPRNKFWLEMLEEVKQPSKWWYIGKHFEIMLRSGPLALSRVANRSKFVISIIPKSLVMPCSVCNINCSTCEAYLKPLEGSSWTSWDTSFLNFWLCNWKKVVSFLVLLLLLILIAYILRKYGIWNGSLDIRDLFR
jgi:mannosyltransferase OCH1-like enzyme